MNLPAVLCDRLRLPVIGSPMYIVSSPKLVIAQCKAGIVGSFPALNARPASQLDDWLGQITEELAAWDRANPGTPSAPFAINQILHKTNDRLERDIELTAKYRVPIVITSLGAREDVNAAIHAYGGVTLHDVVSSRFARKAIERGADGLIAVAAGAGGQAGSLSPFALVQELRQWFSGPLVLSGAIANGRSILAARAMGADLAYVGSAFIATHEANAVDAYKQMVVDSHADDIIFTGLFSGSKANYLRPSFVAAGLDPDNLRLPDPESRLDFNAERPRAWRDLWGAGQGIGAVTSVISAAALIERLAAEYADAKERLLANLEWERS